MLVEVAAALVEDDRAAETLAAVRPVRPGLSDGPGPAARSASPRPSLSSLHGRFVLRVALSCVAQGQKSRRLHNGAGCAPAAAPPDPPVPSREAIFGRRAVEASGWDGGRPGGHRHHSPHPSVSSFSLHLLLGGAVCAVLGTARAYSRGARYACLLRAQVWLWTGGATGDADGYADG